MRYGVVSGGSVNYQRLKGHGLADGFIWDYEETFISKEQLCCAKKRIFGNKLGIAGSSLEFTGS